jgi:hypothetical protein
MKKYNGIIDEVLFYSERSDDKRWIIPIEVDWDFTLTKCSCWNTGEMVLNDEAFEIMKRWSKEYNVGWILNSMRSDELLKEPLRILENKGIKLYGLRKNPKQLNDESNKEVTKTFAVFSIDDRGVCIPSKWLDGCDRPYVDWIEVDKIMSPILKYMSNNLDKVIL